MTTIAPQPKRHPNGHRSWTIRVSDIIQGPRDAYRRELPRIDELIAYQFIRKKFAQWVKSGKCQRKHPMDLLHCHGAVGNSTPPGLYLSVNDHRISNLHDLMDRVRSNRYEGEWKEFLRDALGVTTEEHVFDVTLRKPKDYPFEFLHHLHGVRLKKSPNRFHPLISKRELTAADLRRAMVRAFNRTDAWPDESGIVEITV
jgi:hypothetical protein